MTAARSVVFRTDASSRIAHGAEASTPRGMRLARILQDDGYLFFRFVRSES